MAFATQTDVESALGRDLTASESESVQWALEEATDLLVGYLGCEPGIPYPDPVTRVCARMVARMFAQQASMPVVGASQVQQTAGPYSQSVSFTSGSASGSVWLEKTDKMRLRSFRCGGGLRSVRVESEQSGRYRRYE